MESTTHLDLTDKTVLVTGGTGTIGSAIVEHLLASSCGGIRIYSRDEHKQFELRQRLPDDERLRFLIGDTRDLNRLRRAMEDVSIVFHAAAMKHVTACEYNPFEAIQTNVVGTQNVIDAAIEHDVDRLLFASSDKAVHPTSTMGVSKLLAEKLISAADFSRGKHPTVFTSVRLGNVVGSRGSVLPLFASQIATGGPLTLTDKRMTRFIMPIERAVGLMLEALALARGGEVFVLKMPALRIEDLAEALRSRLAPVHGMTADDVDIVEVGAQLGEKFYEELVADEELERCLETDNLFIVLPQLAALHPEHGGGSYTYPGAKAASGGIRSDLVAPMTSKEISALLTESGVGGTT